ncbi:MAG: polyhydroxyalkanoic acid system family protein [Planctomycetota bacterium]
MPKFDVSVPNPLGKQAALDRLQGFSDKLRERHADKIKDIEQQWDGDRMTFGFKTMGLRIEGEMLVEEDAVRVSGDLPFAAAMFKGQLTGAMEDQLQKLLGKEGS